MATRKEAAKSSVPAVAKDDKPAAPSFLAKYANQGRPELSRDDLEIPRLKLIQALSPELQEWDELRPGHFWHTANEETLGTEFEAVPIYMDKRYVLWRPRDMGGGILARADDGLHWNPANETFEVQLDKKDGGAKVKWSTKRTVAESGLANWGSMDPSDPNSPPAATLMYTYVLGFPDRPDVLPAVLTFQRSSIKAGRKLNTKLLTTTVPMFGLRFRFESFMDKNSRGQDFFNVRAQMVGYVNDERLFLEYKDMHDGFAAKGLAIKDLEDAQSDDPEETAAPEVEKTVDKRTGKTRDRF